MTRSDAGAPSQQRAWPLLVVLAGVVLGLVVSVLGESTWRIGALLVGAALLGGAAERLVLSDRAAGLLQVRGKAFDVAVLGLAGMAIIVLALVVPPGR